MSDDNTIIHAQVVLFSPSGKSITDSAAAQGNINELLPSAQAKKTVAKFFEKKGFIINTDGPSLSVSGKKSLFEKVFRFSVKLRKKGSNEYATAVTKPVIPHELQHLLKEIVFAEPAEYFG